MSFLNVAMMVILSNGVCCFGEYIVKMVTILYFCLQYLGLETPHPCFGRQPTGDVRAERTVLLGVSERVLHGRHRILGEVHVHV